MSDDERDDGWMRTVGTTVAVDPLEARTTVMTADEVGAVARVTGKTIMAMVRRGVGPAHVRIGKKMLFFRKDVEAWLEAGRREGR
jgi:excisionase family DNA binding protein